MGKCAAKERFFCVKWPRRQSKITFKTVDVFTKYLPAQVIDTSVVVHTIKPPLNEHKVKAGIRCAEHVPQSGRLSGLPLCKDLCYSVFPFTLENIIPANAMT